MIRVNDIFSGIGGMALGLERTGGFRIASFSEIDPFRCRVLHRHWPAVRVFGDIKRIHADAFPKADWLIGGPPCHRTSIAAAIHGNWTGETLWPQMRRIIKEGEYRGVIVEQPAKHKGWIAKVHRDLERDGYEVQKYLIEAADVGALHSRERVFFVAHRYGARLSLPREERPPEVGKEARLAATGGNWDPPDGRVLRMDDRSSGRVDGSRRARIQAVGSSCVPQVAEVLGRIILKSFRR